MDENTATGRTEPDGEQRVANVLTLLDWRRRINELYAAARQEPNPERSHMLWRLGRDELFRTHPQSPLRPDDPMRKTGLRHFPYDPTMRFEVPLQPVVRTETVVIDTAADGRICLELVGQITLAGLGVGLGAWRIAQYAGGLFVPLRDGTAGTETYGGGRYLIDTAKGADLGTVDGRLVIDLNFLYHPSCRYDSAWDCPLAPADNTTRVPIRAGERL